MANEVLFSTVCIWEIAIKAACARRGFDWNPSAILSEALDSGFAELKITSSAAIAAARLPPYHRDPFDRLLVGQVMTEPASLTSADAMVKKYSELIDLM